ncbi:MAG TPA: Hsp70 family protein [Pseudonocardiaceae bacterium]|jgi:actin-like ATPase involved in cell morphogenesis|nr:Hsp70 family protein [Pseudonocardiaceae bacterium]
MGYWLGIDAGSTFTAAAVCREDGERWGPPEIVALGARSAAVSSVVYLDEGGQVVVGEAAERRVVTDPDRVVRGFKRRIGDEVPIVVGGVAYAAPEIAAMMIQWVVEQVAAREGSPAAGIVLTHPAAWGSYKVEVLARALGAAGLPQIRFCTEPEAAAAGYAMQERIEPGSTIAVYDLGGGTFDAAVVRKTDAGGFCVLGQPQGLEQLGGVDFDDAVFGHVLAAVPALAGLDTEDPGVLAATAALRRECIDAKEALSADTVVTIPVLAPGIQSQVRLVRAEFEDMIRAQIGETVQALRRSLQSAQLEAEELDVVLLVGGSSRVPLVAQLVSAELGRPVAVDADPKAAIALGAALLAAPDVPTISDPSDHELPTESPAQFTETNLPIPSPVHLPERPTLLASPRTEPGESEQPGSNSRRTKQVAFAAVLALGTAAGVVSVPFLIAHSDPNSSKIAGTVSSSAAPAPGTPAGAPLGPDAADPRNPAAGAETAGTTGGGNSPRAGSGGSVRTTLPAAPGQPAGGVAKPNPASDPTHATAPSWVTSYTWTTSWSSPPPTTPPASTPATTPHPTSRPPSSAPPATTMEVPPSRTAPPATTAPSPPR